MSVKNRHPARPIARRATIGIALALLLSLTHAGRARALEPGVEVFAVNSYATGTQSEPVVAAQGRGHYVVVWTSTGQDGDAEGIFARIVDEHAVAVSAEIAVNETTVGSQAHPSVAATPAGDFVVTWQSGGDAFARQFTAAGEPVGQEALVAENVWRAPVGIDATGRYAVTYRRGGTIFVRRFLGGILDPLQSETPVNDFADNLGEPDIGMAPGGNFVVAWHNEVYVTSDPYGQQARRDSAVLLQRIASDGTQQGSLYIQAPGNENHYPRPDVTDEGFVVAWSGCYSDPGDYQARPCTGGHAGAKRFTAGGAQATEAFAVSGADGNVYGDILPPDSVLHASQRMTVVWNGLSPDNQSEGIFARQFATTAPDIPHVTPVPFSKTLLVDPAVDGNRASSPHVDANSSDRFLAVWARDGDVYAASVRAVGICTDYSQCRPPAEDTGRLRLRRGVPGQPDGIRFAWIGETSARSCLVDEGAANRVLASILMYDHPGGSPRTILDAGFDAPICGSPPCWRYEGPYRVAFEDPAGQQKGITKVRFRVGQHGRAKLIVRLAGAQLSAFPLPLAPPVNVEFSGASVPPVGFSGVGFCAHARFPTATTNTSDAFLAEDAIDFSPQP